MNPITAADITTLRGAVSTFPLPGEPAAEAAVNGDPSSLGDQSGMSPDSAVWTLPPTIDVATAVSILGVGRTLAYQLIRTGSWPTPVLHLGHKIRIPTATLLRLLGQQPKAEAQSGYPQIHPGGSPKARSEANLG